MLSKTEVYAIPYAKNNKGYYQIITAVYMTDVDARTSSDYVDLVIWGTAKNPILKVRTDIYDINPNLKQTFSNLLQTILSYMSEGYVINLDEILALLAPFKSVLEVCQSNMRSTTEQDTLDKVMNNYNYLFYSNSHSTTVGMIIRNNPKVECGDFLEFFHAGRIYVYGVGKHVCFTVDTTRAENAGVYLVRKAEEALENYLKMYSNNTLFINMNVLEKQLQAELSPAITIPSGWYRRPF